MIIFYPLPSDTGRGQVYVTRGLVQTVSGGDRRLLCGIESVPDVHARDLTVPHQEPVFDHHRFHASRVAVVHQARYRIDDRAQTCLVAGEIGARADGGNAAVLDGDGAVFEGAEGAVQEDDGGAGDEDVGRDAVLMPMTPGGLEGSRASPGMRA